MVETMTEGVVQQTLCAFAPCTCPVDADGDYCVPTCRMGIGETGEPCKCGHGECTSTTGDG